MKFNIKVELENNLLIQVDNGLESTEEGYKLTISEKAGKAIQTAKQCIPIDDIDIVLIGIRKELEKHLNEV